MGQVPFRSPLILLCQIHLFDYYQFAAQEVAAARPGSATVLAKLSELMFVEAVREYVNGLPAERQGWLAGLRDPAIGRALALIHSTITPEPRSPAIAGRCQDRPYTLTTAG